jgi:hypothetical protein
VRRLIAKSAVLSLAQLPFDALFLNSQGSTSSFQNVKKKSKGHESKKGAEKKG